ncbi:MAG: hypothetical protein IJE46_01625 [Clostridia bacterium]|nr:hypothetical protein [Clostridia bacterium]
MKKIDNVVLKETGYIASVTVILSVLMQVLFVISGWSYTHLLGNILGAFATVANFFIMGITVQKAVLKEESEAKKLIKFSQSARLFGLFVIALIGHLVPFFDLLAVIIPMLFPRIAIMIRPFIIKD